MLGFRNMTFIKSATAPAHYPPDDTPELAIVGRSNVGKSSLLNALCDNKGLARVSKTPGRTQLVNFFGLDGAVRIVDLPGYGFADVPEKVQATWDKMMQGYLLGRKSLIGLLLLLDIRRTPSRHDMAMFSLAASRGLPVLVVLTKTDKVGKNEAYNQTQKLAKLLGASPKQFVRTSSLKKSGMTELRESISAIVEDELEFRNHVETLDDEKIEDVTKNV